MNKIESLVYNAVRKNPALKQFVRDIYQSVFDLLPRKANTSANPLQIKEGYFFGFHDVSPWNESETKLLGMKAPFDLRMPRAGEKLEVGYFDFSDGEIGDFHKIGESEAWNWHKGCRLQWLDDDRVIFNTAADGKLISRIVSTSTGDSRDLPFPIDSTGSGMASTFSYERLERCMPGYGYPYKQGEDLTEAAPADSGLSIMDHKDGSKIREITLDRMALEATGKIESEYLHFATHTAFSPDGRYLAFLYRRIPRGDDFLKRRSMIGIYDIELDKLSFLDSQESGSHYVWNKQGQLILSGNYDGKNCHMLFAPAKGGAPRLIAPEVLNSDGHQSWIGTQEFVTDTYPDRRRMARIYKANTLTGKTEQLLSIYSPKAFQTRDYSCHIACDLHPRVSPSGQYLCIDTPTTGCRSLAVMKLPQP